MQRPPIFEADDGNLYVLKLDSMDPDFPVSELISAGLASHFGVLIPPFDVLYVPEALCDAMEAMANLAGLVSP